MTASEALPIRFWGGKKPNLWHVNHVRYRILYREPTVINEQYYVDIPTELMIFSEFWSWWEGMMIVVMLRIS